MTHFLKHKQLFIDNFYTSKKLFISGSLTEEIWIVWRKSLSLPDSVHTFSVSLGLKKCFPSPSAFPLPRRPSLCECFPASRRSSSWSIRGMLGSANRSDPSTLQLWPGDRFCGRPSRSKSPAAIDVLPGTPCKCPARGNSASSIRTLSRGFRIKLQGRRVGVRGRGSERNSVLG